MQNKENFASRTYPKRRTAWSIEQQQIEKYGHRFETTRGKNMEARRQLGDEKYPVSRSTKEEEQSQRVTKGMERGALQQERTTVMGREMKKALGMIGETNTKGKGRNPLLSGPNAADLERSTVVERG